ncbi:MAG: hypothetical protein RLZZ65_1554 [Bacteroidota bacterium]
MVELLVKFVININMKFILILSLALLSHTTFSQKLYKDKTSTLSSISNKGYTCTKDARDPNIYTFRQYDNYGESLVQLTFEGNYLRKAVYIHQDATKTLTRLRDVYAKTTDSEADTFNPPSNGSGSGIASHTPYYDGKARFEANNNYSSSRYTFTVIILD